MPYCTQCGKQVESGDRFCAGCGASQKGTATGQSTGDLLGTIQPRTAALLCYIPVLGWVAAVAVLAAQRFREDRTVRFHAFQGLYLFVAWLLLDYSVLPFLPLGGGPFFLRFGFGAVLKALVFGAWIFMILKTSQNEDYHLPLFGDLAERSLSEQR